MVQIIDRDYIEIIANVGKTLKVIKRDPNFHKKFRISTPRLDKDIKSDNRPLLGGNLLIHQIDLPR